MKCPECGTKVSRDNAICPSCGAVLRGRVATVRCRICGARVPKGVHICPQCGRPPTLRGRVGLLALSIVLGIVLGVGVYVAGRSYVPDLRYRLGVLLIQESGMGGEPAPTLTPEGTPGS
ncbi:MAG: zinc-ribbon domain-containing protein [Anaerolineae bacterium]